MEIQRSQEASRVYTRASWESRLGARTPGFLLHVPISAPQQAVLRLGQYELTEVHQDWIVHLSAPNWYYCPTSPTTTRTVLGPSMWSFLPSPHPSLIAQRPCVKYWNMRLKIFLCSISLCNSTGQPCHSFPLAVPLSALCWPQRQTAGDIFQGQNAGSTWQILWHKHRPIFLFTKMNFKIIS